MGVCEKIQGPLFYAKILAISPSQAKGLSSLIFRPIVMPRALQKKVDSESTIVIIPKTWWLKTMHTYDVTAL